VLRQMRSKYREYGIQTTPFVIVKADAGTYGMGILSVKDASELRNLNRKRRSQDGRRQGRHAGPRRSSSRKGCPPSRRCRTGVAEPVVYMIDRYVVGGFYRVHTERGATRT
jgi:glutamate--cysteine ligase